jgi:hypothetical protein
VSNVKSQNSAMSWDDALKTVAGYYTSGMFGEENAFRNWPKGTFFGYRDLLDSFIKTIQAQESINTVQVTREPQHSKYSIPAYAFEVLLAEFGGQYRYSSFCQNAPQAVFNPFDYGLAKYVDKGYIEAGLKDGEPLSAWMPGPQSFRNLFNMSGVFP